MKHRYTALAATLLGLGCSTLAQAAGFALIEHSVTGLGNAFAGGAAAAEDGATVFSNPAGMTRLDAQANVGLHIISPTVNYKDRGSTHAVTMGSLDVNNSDGGEAGPTAYVPNFYYIRPVNESWTFGLGINAPFGLATRYDHGWVGRYHALASDLKTININPSLAYKVNDRFSVGFGLDAQYMEARLSSAIDFGTIFAATMAVAPQGADGEGVNEGDDWSLGYNLGLLWQATDQTRIGVAYRSRVKHQLKGEVEFKTTPLVQTLIAGFGGGAFVDSDIKADVELPDSLSASFYHDIDNKWSIMGDVTWTNWSTLDELRIEFDNPAQPDSVTTLKWTDNYRYSLGVTYKYSEKWTWRAGVAYDESPSTNSFYRTPRVPDGDRTWLALGFSYKPSSNMTFDLGYAHLFVADAKLNKQSLAVNDENFLRGNLVGDYETDVNTLSVQVRWSF